MPFASRFKVALYAAMILLVAVSIASWLTLRHIQNVTKQHNRELMSQSLANIIHDITLFNQEVQRSLLFSLNNPMFKEYFSLPETRKGNRYDDRGHLLFTVRQEQLRQRMELWVLSLHRRFPIAETCLIDRHGQEHLRIAGGVVAPPDEFSAEESDSPFFKATFVMDEGQTFRSNPYMSPDANAWVIAFTSPIQLPDAVKPAFYHLEIPIAVYQRILRQLPYTQPAGETPAVTSIGERHLLINQAGLVIADSDATIDYSLRPERNPQINPNLPDFLPPEKLSDYAPKLASLFSDPAFQTLSEQVLAQESGYGEFQHEGQHYRLIFKTLPNDAWRIATLMPILRIGANAPPRTLLAAALLILLVGIGTVALLTGRAQRPPF